jgi:hypothetical protein
MLTRLLGISALLTLLAAGVLTSHAKETQAPTKLPGHTRNSVLELQYYTPAAGVSAIVDTPGSVRRAAVRTSIDLDYWFIASYALLFVLGGLFLRKRGSKYAGVLGLLVIAIGLGAAAADLWENSLMKVLVAATTEHPDSHVALVARLKWGLCFTAMGMMAFAFRRRPVASGVIGASLALAAVIGLAATLPPVLPLLQPAMLLMLIALIVLAVTALTKPSVLADVPKNNTTNAD